jgi:hypothetical protein
MLTEVDHGRFTVTVEADIGPFGGRIEGRREVEVRR